MRPAAVTLRRAVGRRPALTAVGPRDRAAVVGPGDRAAVVVGVATLAIGGALVARPARFGRLLALDEPRVARLVGALDLALVPGLVLGPRRAPWLAGRVALNLAIAGYAVQAQRHTGRSSRALAAAALMVGVSIGDGSALRAVLRSGHGRS